MELYLGNWLFVLLNAILIALILAAPLLVGILIIRVLRKGVYDDRQSFEVEIRSKLTEISDTQAKILERLDDLSGR